MPRFTIQNAIPVFLFLGIGCMCAYFGIVQGVDRQAMKSWPQVEAIVLESKAIFLDDSEAEVKMLVEYSIEQTQYQAYVYASDFLEADFIPPQYEVGKIVSIYYPPDDPSNPICHLPSVMSAVFVVLISLLPIAAALRFIIPWIVIGYLHWKMFRAKLYLKRANQDVEQFNQHLEQHKANGHTLDSELLDKQNQLKQDAENVQTILNILQTGIDDLTPPPEGSKVERKNGEDKPLTKETLTPIIKQPRENVFQQIAKIILLSVCPLMLGLVMTWYAPYYLITCERNGNETVDCNVQQILFGLINFGEPEKIIDLTDVEYEMKGEIRKKRAFLRLTGKTTKEICAGRAAFTTKSIKQFLENANLKSLQVSDGHTILSLYFPYVLAMFSFAALFVANKELPIPNQATPFLIGALVACSVVAFPFLYLYDIYNTDFSTWLILVTTIIIGGVINIFWHRK